MMKTPEEIKKGLECECAQSCQGCPYREEGNFSCSVFLHNDIYDLIQQLEQRCDAAQMNASSAIRELAEVRLKCLKQIEAIAKKVPKWISVEERLPEEVMRDDSDVSSSDMDDLISRRVAIEQLERREKLLVCDKRIGVEHVKVFLQNCPAIDAEPVRHGKWMICYYNEESKEHESVTYNPYTFRNPDGAMFCSECGLDALRNVHAEHVPSAWCPHCGAVMDLNEVECK